MNDDEKDATIKALKGALRNQTLINLTIMRMATALHRRDEKVFLQMADRMYRLNIEIVRVFDPALAEQIEADALPVMPSVAQPDAKEGADG